MCPREFGAQPLTGLQLVRLDHHPAVTSPSAGKPSQWTFVLVDNDFCTACLRGDVTLSQSEMLCAKAVDLRLLQLLFDLISYVHLCASVSCNHPRIIYLSPVKMKGPRAHRVPCPQLLGFLLLRPGSQPDVTLHAGAAVAQAPFVSRAVSAPLHNLARPSDSQHSAPTSHDTARASCCTGYASAVSAI